MHRSWIFGPALAALAVSGCSSQPAAPSAPTATATPVKAIYALNPCDGDTSGPVGTVNIIVPKNISSKKLDRMVNYGPPIDVDSPVTGESPPFQPNANKMPQPYDVYLSGTNYGSNTTGFVMVRVLSRKNDNWQFFERGGIYGVAGEDPSGTAVCGANPIVPGKNPGGQDAGTIAHFYVDLSQFQDDGKSKAVSFVIGLQEDLKQNDLAQTPVFIDPAIHPFGDPFIDP